MLQAGVGLSTQKDTRKAAREAAQTALSRTGSSTADFALVFATAGHGPGYSLLLRTIQQITHATHVVGCSAGGVLATDGEIERASGVAVLAVHADTFTASRFFMPQLRGRGYETGKEIAAYVQPRLRA